MAAMKLAFFFLTLSALLGAYHARHLHDGCIYQGFDLRPTIKTTEVIQMFTGDNLEARPSPKGPLPGGETIYGRDNPKAPRPPKAAPSSGQTTYDGDNLISNSKNIYGVAGVAKKRLSDLVLPLQYETLYGRHYLKAQPSSHGGGSEGEAIYGRDKVPQAQPAEPTRPVNLHAVTVEVHVPI